MSPAMARTMATSTSTEWRAGGHKKVSRSDWRHKQLYIHWKQTIEKVDNIDEWMESHGWEKFELTNNWTIGVAIFLRF